MLWVVAPSGPNNLCRYTDATFAQLSPLTNTATVSKVTTERDLHTAAQDDVFDLGGGPIGRLRTECVVMGYTCVKNLKHVRGFIIDVHTRIIVPNRYTYAPIDMKVYANYPAAIAHSLTPKLSSGVSVQLLDYLPKTINSSIDTDQSGSISNQTSTSTQVSRGSSFTETNNYEVSTSLSGSLGFFGNTPTGDISGSIAFSQGHSEMTSSSYEQANGNSRENAVHTGLSTSMSIKDWATYSQVGENNDSVKWLWGQEYPWDVLTLHNTINTNSGTVVLPKHVQQRMFDAGSQQVFPPSQLSLYGVNFHSQARFVCLAETASEADEQITLAESLSYFTASHQVEDNSKTSGFVASINASGTYELNTNAFNLPLLALNPITSEGSGNLALVGFTRTEFILPPSANGVFRIESVTNNLYIIGSGFDSKPDADGLLHASFYNGSSASVTVYFKLSQNTHALSLYMKHWKTTPRGCVLKFTLNGITSDAFDRHVDSMKATDADDNVTVVILRNLRYADGEYFNYLVPGLNCITIMIAPAPESGASSIGCGYSLRAMAVQ